MLKTIIWTLWFMVFMILSGLVLVTYNVLKLFSSKQFADRYAYFFTRFWGRTTILSTGSKVTVIGRENISDAANICFIANHQSLFDIPLLMGWMGRPLGFIAKKELKKVPVINGWITAIHSAFIDRSNPRSAIESINKGSESIKSGFPIVIFPEGTRSKTGLTSEFKTGSLKLATNASAAIQPVTISGTFHVYEEKKRICKSAITLKIHKPIYPEDEIYKDKVMLTQYLQQIISLS